MDPEAETDDWPAVDDRVRSDGGNSTDEEHVPLAEMRKLVRRALDHSRDEPGS